MRSFFLSVVFWVSISALQGQSSIPFVESNGSYITLPKELPVIYRTFIAKRWGSRVDLVWETSLECNSKGFEVLRKSGDGEWRKVAFVFTQAVDGNSNSLLTYEYTDVNTEKGGSQYRLRQIDTDLQVSDSEMRSIKGY